MIRAVHSLRRTFAHLGLGERQRRIWAAGETVYTALKVSPRFGSYRLCISRDITSDCEHNRGSYSDVNESASAATTADASSLDSIVIHRTSSKSAASAAMPASQWLEYIKGLESHMDVERELHGVKKVMGSHYSQGNYQAALECASQLEEAVSATIGKENAIYASCLNNIALMNKMLGNTAHAMDKYTQALHLYGTVVGKMHSSYASTLSNIGILYRSMSEAAGIKGMERLQLVERAQEALQDALSIRISLAPDQQLRKSKEALNVAMNLAMVHRLTGGKGVQKCEEDLRGVLEMARQTYGQHDSLTALVLSNLGFMLKCVGPARYADAKLAYSEALDVRSKTLGDAHPDTIVSMHNLAELLLAMGDTGEGTRLQEEILAIMEKSRSLTVTDKLAERPPGQDGGGAAARGTSQPTSEDEFQPNAPAPAPTSASASAPALQKSKTEAAVPLVTFATRRGGKGAAAK